MSKTLLLVDGNALIYRAYHAFPKELTTKAGDPIGAVYGFTRILLSTISDLKPEQVAVSFDIRGGTFRHAQFANYKANRESMPEDLAAQMDTAHKVVEHLELPIYAVQGYEADDCIATIARQATESDPEQKVIVLSGDMDLLQMVNDRVTVLRPASPPKVPTFFTPEKVREQYGFGPDMVPDYKGLRGDTSDNIPGVPGIGEVTATKLLALYPGLDLLYAALAKEETPEGMSASIAKKLRDNEALARECKDLATVLYDAPVQYKAEDCALSLAEPEKLVKLFHELGFKSLMQYLPTSHKALASVTDIFGESVEEEKKDEKPAELVPESESEKNDTLLAPILRDMEEYGVLIDRPYLRALQDELGEEIISLREQLHILAGQEFNPDSPSQVGTILYEVLHLPTEHVRKGKTGYTTDASTLQDFAPNYPIAAKLLEYRELTKLQSTYVLPLQEIADQNDRLHTSYSPDAASGRISSRNPNLQNIPSKTETGRRIRQAFIAPPGTPLVGADYAQMELRVAAHLSGDENLCRVFAEGRDVHTETAEKMGVDRRVAKMINFSILYGKGAYGFSQDLGVTMAEAKAYIAQYFATYPKLREYLDNVVRIGREKGYVETMFGKRRPLPDLTSSNAMRRAAAEREAFNHPIQGSQADILKRAMINLSAALPKKFKMILTVHDELILEVPEGREEEAGKLIKQYMESAVTLSVPVVASVKQGKNWAGMEATN